MSKKELTIEETSRILKFYKETGDCEALEVIMISYMGLVVNTVKKYLNSGIEFDDLKSVGTIGLINAINKFNIEKPIEAFSSYISIAIDNQIKMELRQLKKHRNIISLDAPIGKNEYGIEKKIEDIVGTDEDQVFDYVISKLKINIIREALKSLTLRQQKIILLRYGLDDVNRKTQAEIGKIFGCSQKNISLEEQKALIKMRHHKDIRKYKDCINN